MQIVDLLDIFFYLTLTTYDGFFYWWIKGEYDRDIPQSQTADKPNDIARKSHTTITNHHDNKQSKATRSLFLSKMIAKLEWT